MTWQAPVTAPVPDFPIRPGARWLAETRSGKALEITEREGGLHVCLTTGGATPHPSWANVQQLYDYYLRDPIVLVVDENGSEWRATSDLGGPIGVIEDSVQGRR